MTQHLDKQGGSVLSSFLALLGVHDEEKPVKEFVGTWAVEDSDGEPFEITLDSSGSAEADRNGEGMSGTWEMFGSSAIVTWDTGWTTKITRTGESYLKTAYDRTATAPSNTSPAEKIAD